MKKKFRYRIDVILSIDNVVPFLSSIPLSGFPLDNRPSPKVEFLIGEEEARDITGNGTKKRSARATSTIVFARQFTQPKKVVNLLIHAMRHRRQETELHLCHRYLHSFFSLAEITSASLRLT